ncbi:hypothetical protein TNCV_3579681 [Trichonephila clavipes]|nr:hypothetical protein TNCV_3579681 [Trichonephila clavipes]
MRKAIWAVWGHCCSTDDEPMHWFCPTNPNTWYLSHLELLKKCLGEKFGLKINRNVCVSLAERDNRRIFTSRQRRLESSFEARRAKKIKKSKEIQLFQEQEESLAFIITTLERSEAFSRFSLTTGHDFWGILPLLAWPGCCDHAKMDCDHLLQCIDLMNTQLTRHHEEAWRQIIKKPSMGVG